MTDIISRLRQTRANMLGTPDQQHYWDCHEAADYIEQLEAKLKANTRIYSSQPYKSAFDQFWAAYPCKKGKLKAEQAFQKVAKDFCAIMAGVEQYKRHKPPHLDWLHPSTFLNQRRWEDEYDAPPVGRTYNTQKDGLALLLQEANRRENDVEQGAVAGNVVQLIPRPNVERGRDESEDRGLFDGAGTLF